jgi:hypothetical protein
MPISLEFPPVSFLQFWLTTALGALIIFGLGMYIFIFVWHFGKPLREYFTVKLMPGYGIVQEYTNENLKLRIADVDNDEFIIATKKPKEHFWDKQEYNYSAPLVSKSILQINGVKTLMAWNVTPPLPGRYLTALEALNKLGISEIGKLYNDIKVNTINVNDVIKGTAITFGDFLELHNHLKEKYSIVVTPDDILNFEDKFLDEHPIRSVVKKEIVVRKKRYMDNKLQKWAFIIIGAMVILSFVMIAYKIYKSGGAV